MGKGSSKASVGPPQEMTPPELAEVPGEPYYSEQSPNAQSFNRGHQLQMLGSPMAFAYGSRPIDWTKSSMLAQRLPGLQDMLAASMKGSQFANVPRPAPMPQPEVVKQVAAAPAPAFPQYSPASQYEIDMNDGIDPTPWRTDWHNWNKRRG